MNDKTNEESHAGDCPYRLKGECNCHRSEEAYEHTSLADVRTQVEDTIQTWRQDKEPERFKKVAIAQLDKTELLKQDPRHDVLIWLQTPPGRTVSLRLTTVQMVRGVWYDLATDEPIRDSFYSPDGLHRILLAWLLEEPNELCREEVQR